MTADKVVNILRPDPTDWKKHRESWNKYHRGTREGTSPYLSVKINHDRKLIPSGLRTLELGMGQPMNLEGHIGRDKLFVGTDIDVDTMIEVRNWYNMGNPSAARGSFAGVQFGDGNYLPFADKSFDRVVCIDALCIAGSAVPSVLHEMRRLTAYEGKIIFSLPHEDAFNLKEKRGMLKTLSHLKLVNYKNLNHFDAVFTEYGLTRLLKELGFGKKDIHLQTYTEKELHPPFLRLHRPNRSSCILAVIRRSPDEKLPGIYNIGSDAQVKSDVKGKLKA